MLPSFDFLKFEIGINMTGGRIRYAFAACAAVVAALTGPHLLAYKTTDGLLASQRSQLLGLI